MRKCAKSLELWKVWERIRKSDIVTKCDKCWEKSMRKYEKIWENMRKYEKIWESMRKFK